MQQNPEKVTQLDDHGDKFLAKRLPQWLKQASQGQINKLRDSYKAHRQSHVELNKKLADLVTPQAFARKLFTAQLGKAAAALGLDELEWIEVRRRFTVKPGITLPEEEITYLRTPALMRLMQNFPGGDPFYTGSGLVAKGQMTVLEEDVNAFSRQCRQLDAGRQYQEMLSRTITDTTRTRLAEHKRTGFTLALELAALKGQVDGVQQAALRAVLTGEHGEKLPRAYTGQLKVLECPVHDALLIQLRDSQGGEGGVVLYLPADPQHALRHFDGLEKLNQALAEELKTPETRSLFYTWVPLHARAEFKKTLEKRVLDDVTDLQPQGTTIDGDVFAHLADVHVQRLRDDARMLLVTTADADKGEASERLARWEGIGMGALGIAGLFVPELGALLLAQLAAQVTGETYDGISDWAQGHQHDAAEQLLGVAEMVAFTALTVVGTGMVIRGFTRSEFVDALEPVSIDEQEARLWNHDLSPYEVTRGMAVLEEDGLYREGTRRLVRIDSRYYEVHRPQQHGPWRLRHPSRTDAFEPALVSNGERGWRLRLERPLEWDDSARMLERLWPSEPARSEAQVAQILQVSGVDKDELRGLLVENRQLPVNLRDTLRRFEADQRITRLLDALRRTPAAFIDADVLAWCKAHPDLQRLADTEIGSELLDDELLWRGRLLEHLAALAPQEDAVLSLLKRDFPGLPDAYAREALLDLDPTVRNVAVQEQRIPLPLATKVRSLLQLARVNRALEVLYLPSAYSDDGGELVFALLRKLPGWPRNLNLELRKSTESGRLLAVLDPQGEDRLRTVMVFRQGRFQLYDNEGLQRDLDIAEPASIFDALVAMLDTPQLAALGLSEQDAAQQLRDQLAAAIPSQRQGVFNLLGWRNQAPWFNPGTRLADGRVGYTLGGRHSSREYSTRTLLDRIRALYPNFNEQRVRDFFDQLMLAGGSPFDDLLEHEHNYAQLDQTLTQWTARSTDPAMANQRQHFANQLRGAWRGVGEVDYESADGRLRINLSGWRIGRLPSLPAEVDMSLVGELMLAGMNLDEVPAGFLRCFPHVHTLVLTNNRLTALPFGLSYLTELRTLRLMANRIRIDGQSQELLRTMSYLHTLDLSHNPLRTLDLRFTELPELRTLRLGHCRLQAMPTGLERCGFLDFADLSDNQIETIPPELVRMPWSFRARLNLNRNPLSTAERQRLYGLAHQRHGGELHLPVITDAQLAPWLGDQPEARQLARTELWRRLHGDANSAELYQLLQHLTEGADFSSARSYLSDQVWGLLTAIDQDEALRTQIFDSAREPMGCVDSSAERFSRLQIQVLVHQATQRSAEADAGPALLALGRRLFRLEALDRFAFEAVEVRRLEDPDLDDLEIVLGYRISLAQVLDLPCQPQTMRFRSLADITVERAQEALNAVCAAETPEAVVQSIARQEFWTTYLRRQHPEPFAVIASDFDARGEALDEIVDTLTSDVYTQRWNELKCERDSAEQALELMLTREALELAAEEG
ncbi:NEL-type E3 ubiquitin ligase domain-containing protein [Pseudomonas sp. NPDC089395]|uniref:NEL-type E3 ubiquitin ligase domain-containing protein n=1 Tax=Pseudomonas sp. NPDC089395 TaxID=3364460 RepID=UPI0038229FF3